jgi:hypothetical protein
MAAFLLYIDPGSGSLLLQLIAGGVLAAGVFVKSYWLRIKSFFRKPGEKDQVKNNNKS